MMIVGSQLSKEGASVYVQPPAQSEPVYVRDMRGVQAELKLQMEQLANALQRIDHLEKGQQRLQQLALRCLLDKSRETLVGRELMDAERGSAWNDKLRNIPIPNGVTRKAVDLTRFGQGTQQQGGNLAAHDFQIVTVADAVTSVQRPQLAALYRQLFLKM